MAPTATSAVTSNGVPMPRRDWRVSRSPSHNASATPVTTAMVASSTPAREKVSAAASSSATLAPCQATMDGVWRCRCAAMPNATVNGTSMASRLAKWLRLAKVAVAPKRLWNSWKRSEGVCPAPACR